MPLLKSAHQNLANQQEGMLAQLIDWSETNSGSFHVEGIERVAAKMKAYIEKHTGLSVTQQMGKSIVRIDDHGDSQSIETGPRLSLKKESGAATKVLLCGHMDTVFPKDSSFQSCRQDAKGILYGPGVADMKGGILVMLHALCEFTKSSLGERLDWEILLNSDEEIGSLASQHAIHAAAQSSHVGLIYEPSMADGYLARARKGSGNFTLVVRGKAAHAGREFHQGRNAITALASAMQQLDQFNHADGDATLNLGRIAGGGPTNIVPDLAKCEFNVRVVNGEEQQRATHHIESVMAELEQIDGITAELSGAFNRPPKAATNAQQRLFSLVEHCAFELDINLGFRDTGGCCDGNNLLAAGVPNIDTLGVVGGEIHSHDEYMHISSLTERAQLSLEILAQLAENPNRWIEN